MRKALVLGTLSPQADAVRYLHDTGWWVIGCGHRRQGMAVDLLDQFELVDLFDFAAVEDLARREGVRLCCSAGSEAALPALAIVPPKLGLRTYLWPELVELLRSKTRLRAFLNAREISHVEWREIRSVADLEGWNRFPSIVKPTDSAGQRGVFRADTMREASAGLERSLGFSRSGTAIIEEFLEGPEVSSNAFVIDSRVAFNEITDRLVVEEYPGGIPRGHVYPSQACTGETLHQTKTLVEQCIGALAIENGPVYFQMKLTSKGPKVLEIMPRLDGCQIWRLLKTAGGVDLLAASLASLAGEDLGSLEMAPAEQSYQLTFFLGPPDTEFAESDYPVPADATYFEYRYKDGQIVQRINTFTEVVGYYIAPVPSAGPSPRGRGRRER